MSFSLFVLLQVMRSQSGFGLAGAEVVGAARGRRLRGRNGGGGRDPGVNGAVCRVLCLVAGLCEDCEGRGGGY